MIRKEIIERTAQSDYLMGEVEVIQSECTECGFVAHDDMLSTCPECNESDIVWMTQLDNNTCDHCGEEFTDGMADHYKYWGNDDEYIDEEFSQLVCVDCYKKMRA